MTRLRHSTFLPRAQWYVARGRAMSKRELAFRVDEQRRRVLARWLPAPCREHGALVAFQQWADRIDESSGDLSLSSRWADTACSVASGRVSLLGQTWGWPTDGVPDWSVDPVTGTSWDSRFAFSIPIRSRGDKGDVKYATELNRLQYLQTTAAVARLEQSEILRRVCSRHVMTWISDNPPLRGLGWRSGIELALRVLSFAFVYSTIPEAFTASERQVLGKSIADHAYWIQRFPSHFSSSNNHRIAELAGLNVAAAVLPSSKSLRASAMAAQAELESEVLAQFHNDGVGAEQSPSYSAFSLEWVLLAAQLADWRGQRMPAECIERIHRAGEHLLTVTSEAGYTPVIGDNDNGRVFLDEPEPHYVGSVAAIAAACTTGQCVAALTPPRSLRNVILGDPTIKRPPPEERVTIFPTGGYSAVRCPTARGEVHWVFDHGPLGHLSLAAHGHADALAVWLHLAGRPVLIDAGTHLYNGPERHRSLSRETAAHNTLTIENTSSSKPSGPFSWGARSNAHLVSSIASHERWALRAEHDGYLEVYGVRHRRTLARTRSDEYDITDELVGRGGPRSVEIRYLLAPDVQASQRSGGWQLYREGEILVCVDVSGHEALEIEETFYSPNFGESVRTVRLVVLGVLWPGHGINTRVRLASRRATLSQMSISEVLS